MSDVTIRVKPVDQPWETIGRDTAAGIVAENVELNYDTGGPSTCSFDLRREALQSWPDIGTLADIVVDTPSVSGVWEGEVAITPRRDGEDRVINVQGRGAQAELDDDIVEYTWIADNLRDWVDFRTVPNAALGTYVTAPQIQTGTGMVSIAWPNGTATGASKFATVMLDLGPGRTAETISIDWSTTSASGGTRAIALGAGYSLGYGDASTTIYSSNSAQTATTNTWTPGQAYRYWYITYATGTTHTPTADESMSITGARVFGKSSYQSSGASVLKGSTVISEALDKGTLVMSTDRSQITATATVIPSMKADDEGNTTREIINKVQALHDYIFKIGPGRVPQFSAKPSYATMEIGAWSPKASDEDASSNDIGEIVNRVLVRGAAPDGTPVRVERWARDATTAVLETAADVAPTNPGFEVDTSGWAGDHTITRTTTAGEFYAGVAGGKMTATLTGDGIQSAAFTGTFRRNIKYTLRFWAKASSASSGNCVVRWGDLSSGTNLTVTGGLSLTTSFQQFSVTWVPTADVTTAALAFSSTWTTLPTTLYMDELSVLVARPTVLDKRYRRRTKILSVGFQLPTDGVVAAALGDTYLNNHKLTPFKGTCTVVGNRSVRDVLTGEYIKLDTLGLRTGQLIRFSDRRDPDTGNWGRDGRLVAVKYRPFDETAELTIDNTSSRFDALLARMGIAVGDA